MTTGARVCAPTAEVEPLQARPAKADGRPSGAQSELPLGTRHRSVRSLSRWPHHSWNAFNRGRKYDLPAVGRGKRRGSAGGVLISSCSGAMRRVLAQMPHRVNCHGDHSHTARRSGDPPAVRRRRRRVVVAARPFNAPPYQAHVADGCSAASDLSEHSAALTHSRGNVSSTRPTSVQLTTRRGGVSVNLAECPLPLQLSYSTSECPDVARLSTVFAARLLWPIYAAGPEILPACVTPCRDGRHIDAQTTSLLLLHRLASPKSSTFTCRLRGP